LPGTESYEREKAAQHALKESEERDRILGQQQRGKDEKNMIEGKKALLAFVGGDSHEEDPPKEPVQPPTPDNANVEVGGSNSESGNGGVHDGVSRAGMVEAMGGQDQGQGLMKDGRKEVVDEPSHVHVGDVQAKEVLEGEDLGVMGMEMGF
jgi:hypothetical protein